MGSIPESLQSTLVDLDFLARIEKGMKPCYNDRVQVSADSWLGAMYRSWHGESRNKMLEHLKETVKKTDEAISNPQNGDFLPLIINSLYGANKGVVNLSETYQNDPEVSKEITVELANMAVHLYRYQYLISEHNIEVRPVETRTGVIEEVAIVKPETKKESPRKVEPFKRPQKPRKGVVGKKSE
jgi:hypothetical protein